MFCLRPWGVDCVADIEAWLIKPADGACDRCRPASRRPNHRTAGRVVITQTGRRLPRRPGRSREILLIDELSLGLAPVVVQRMLELVDTLKERGQTMLIVEQSLNVALAIADRAIFLEKGEVRFEGPAQELLERDDLARAVFFGTEGG